MVALLAADEQFDAAIRLEQLWNELQATYAFPLLCGYPLEPLDGARLTGVVDQICAEHDRIVPAESYTTLTEPVDRLRAITLLQQQARSLEAEIARRQRAEQVLHLLLGASAAVATENARLYREAQDALHQRDEFLTIASHELRTPLATIRLQTQLMLRRLRRDGSADWPTVERAFTTISQQTSKLTRLVEQLMDVSRLDASTLTLTLQLTDLSDLVEHVVRTTVVDTGRRIEVRAAPGIRAWIDPLRVDQLLTNLLDNAIKYGSDDAPIEVELAEHPDGQVQLSVRDHGTGIPEGKRGHVFERFFQAHGEEYQSGMGLGLYLNRQIAELHGGQMTVGFPSDGGTRFVVELPSVPRAPEPRPANPDGAGAATTR
jgi:signal transduction histidine kinase